LAFIKPNCSVTAPASSARIVSQSLFTPTDCKAIVELKTEQAQSFG
jgi:hypothetical protein